MRKVLIGVLVLLLVGLLVAADDDDDDDGGDRRFRAVLTGAEEVPDPVDTDTTGRATFRANRAETEIDFKLKIRRADGILAVAGGHIHCAPAGSNGPVAAFLAGAVPPAGFDGKVEIKATLTDASVLPTDCGTTIAELLDAMRAGDTYVNIHSAGNPAGEIRGQIG